LVRLRTWVSVFEGFDKKLTFQFLILTAVVTALVVVVVVVVAAAAVFLACDAFVRMNRHIIAMVFVHPSVWPYIVII